MTLRHNIFAAIAGMGLLASCSSDFIIPPYTVGEADNAIVLHAGISEGGAGVATRAGVEDHHDVTAAGGGHTTFTTDTQLRLRVDGTWLGKADGSAPHGTISGTTVSQKTTAKIGEGITVNSEGSATHNAVTFTAAEQLYWDDYGTADPANIDTPKGTAAAGTGGRNMGLTIYGVAVDGKTTLPSAPTDLSADVLSWNALAWNVGAPSGSPTPSISQTSGWSDYDLLVSNNVRAESADGTYKFDNRDSGKLLEFTHAMTKVTVNLTAGEGFPRTSATDPATAHFEDAPTVSLLGFNYMGTVNVEDKTSTPTATTANVKMHLATGGATHTATYDALVFPGNHFSDATDILRIEADGNTYYVNATEINAANTEASNTFEQGKNYVFKITIAKTKVTVTATVKNWIDVEAEPETPKINVTATYGYEAGAVTNSKAFTGDYDLFRSTTKATGYDEDSSTDGINPAARYASSAWDKAIYWPNHQTHYFFRGVYPKVGTAVSGTSALAVPEAVTTVSSNDVVAVANATYTAATFPSDLAIAIPRKTDGTYDETCKESGHTSQEGICATEGTIRLNFEHSMSQVEVRLKSTATDDGHIDMNKTNTKVEIIGGYSKGRIKLSDGLHDTFTEADKGNYALSNLDSPASGFLVTSHDAIVPQEIGDGVKFRITVTTNDGGTSDAPSDDKNDVYECQVNTIKESTTSTAISEWKPGKHYIYVLDINKTAINTTVTLTDWETVEASDTVWF